MNQRRYPRTLTDAFPAQEAWRGVLTHYKRPLAARVWDAIFTILISAGAGVGAFLLLAR